MPSRPFTICLFRPGVPLLVGAVLSFALPGAAAAPALPDAGRLLEQVRPPPPPAKPEPPQTTVEEPRPGRAAAAGRVEIKGFRLAGPRTVPDEPLLALLADGIGRELDLGELRDYAARITRWYREKGYLVARAYLPAQEIRDGIVEIGILEGHFGRIAVRNDAHLTDSALAPAENLEQGAAVRKERLESALLKLSDLPGVEVRSTLKPGSTVGAADLFIAVLPTRRLNGMIDLDNDGNRYTGSNRLGASLFWNNPLDRGDQVSLRVQASDGGFAYGRVGYQVPFGPAGTRVGLAYSDLRYRLGKDFEPLDADGSARVGSLYLQHPLHRGRDFNLNLHLGLDAKQLRDRIGATGTETDKHLKDASIGLAGNGIDPSGGSTVFALTYLAGHLGLDPTSRAVDAATARSAGRYDKLTAALQRLQPLGGPIAAYLSLAGQWAGQNLDSSEKFSLGGAYGVRAYPQGEASGDAGWLANAELRWQWGFGWQGAAFYDAGGIRVNASPWAATPNQRHLSGWGLGIQYAGQDLQGRLFVAWKDQAAQPTSDIDRTPRLWAQIVRYF